jgi:hypothetical protein
VRGRTPGKLLRAHLQEKRFPLVLDNVEHVLEASGPRVIRSSSLCRIVPGDSGTSGSPTLMATICA